MGTSKKIQISNKKIILLCLCILLAGVVLLAASIILTPDGRDPEAETAGQTEQTELKEPVTASEKPVQESAKPVTETAASQSSGRTEAAAKTESPAKPETASKTESAPKTEPASKTEDSSGGAQSSSATKPASAAQSAQSGSPAKTDSASSAVKPQNTAGTSSKPEPVQTAPKKSGKIALVLDDGGHNTSQLQPFLQLDYPFAVAVLPKLAHSADCARMVRNAGKVLMLHQPMQAVSLTTDPGPGAILPQMEYGQLQSTLNENINELGQIAGLNNHEGSLITADQDLIGAVLDVCLARDIFFLDSRTNSETKAPAAAAERNMGIYQRDIFLDNVQEESEIRASFYKGLEIADKKGYAVMIGHVWCKNLPEILKKLCDEASAAGYQIVPVTSLPLSK